MLRRLLDWMIDREVRKERGLLPTLEWRALLADIRGELGGYPLYLETRDDRTLPITDGQAGADAADVVSLIVACVREGVPPRESEKAAMELANRLSAKRGLNALPLISRDPASFVGWYVRVRSGAD